MHRDKKVGLALAILLIGIVAAFFRPAPRQEDSPPQLDDVAALNERIAERDVGPYLTGVESDPYADVLEGIEPSSFPPTPDDDFAGFSDQPYEESPADWGSDGFLPGGSSAPEPIAAEAAFVDRGRASNRVEPLNNAWETFRESNTAEAAERASGERTHVVQSGETLTGISEHYFGTQSRFLEIYRLNKKHLSSPNALRAGMTIRIPAGRAELQTSESDAFAPHRDASGPGVFSPFVRRSSRSVTGDQAENDVPASAPRSLSQTPPVDLPTFDGASAHGDANVRDESLPIRAISPGSRTYRVRRGDSLERLAIRFYGKRGAARKIFEANRDRLTSPDAIREGMSLVLP
ncbi:MAG: hypothetical protein CMJ48_03475 [Planctomycetaceae bacterium]|nr:hypothetical protein [Planctomycetaceae bacterium]